MFLLTDMMVTSKQYTTAVDKLWRHVCDVFYFVRRWRLRHPRCRDGCSGCERGRREHVARDRKEGKRAETGPTRDQRARTSPDARPERRSGRTASGHSLRAQPVRPKTVQDRHPASGQELHPHAGQRSGRDATSGQLHEPVHPITGQPVRRRRRNSCAVPPTDAWTPPGSQCSE